jgi:hypothetical protein
LAAGDQGIVVHAGAEDRQPTLATERIVQGTQQRALRCEHRHQLIRQHHPEVVEVPGGVAEEAVIATVMAAFDGSAGLDNFRDEPAACAKTPTGGHGEEDGEGGRGEDGPETL